MAEARETSKEVAERPASVLFATPADEEDVYDFLVASLWKHNDGMWGIPYDPITVLKQIEIGTRPKPENRSDPTDKRCGSIGIIRDTDTGKIVAAIGLYIMPQAWFTTMPALTELFFHVAPGARNGRGLHRDLFAFARWMHDFYKNDPSMRGWNAPFPLFTGFLHGGSRFPAMERLWQMASGAKKFGVLFARW